MLNKLNRITKQKEFDAFFGKDFKQKKGRNVSGRFMILKCFENGLKNSRFGFVINNKVDKRATERNKIKRSLREYIRMNMTKVKSGYDCIIIVKPSIKTQEKEVVEKELGYLLKKVGLV